MSVRKGSIVLHREINPCDLQGISPLFASREDDLKVEILKDVV